MSSRPCVGYCGGHHPTREMVVTNDGPMCYDCNQKRRDIKRGDY